VFKKGVLMRIFNLGGSDKEDEENSIKAKLNNLYSSSNIVSMIKSRKIRLMGYVAYMGRTRKGYKSQIKNPKGRDHLEDLAVDRRIILKCILIQKNGLCGYDSFFS
jgi:hypothetical protein